MWKPLYGYENYYLAHPKGLIKRIGSVKTIAITGKKYARVHLSQNGIKNKPLLHRLIALTFLSDSFKHDLVINHIDGNPFNNSIENLEWVTQAQNVQHSYIVLKRRNSRAKYILNTETGIFYDTIKEAALTTGYSYQSIRHKLSGKWPNNTALKII